MSQPITAQDLRECTAELAVHARLHSGGYLLIKRCVEHPSLTVSEGRHSRREKLWRKFRVGDQECDTLEEAARLLTSEPTIEVRAASRPSRKD